MKKEHVYSSKRMVAYLPNIRGHENNAAKILMDFYKDYENIWYKYIDDVFYNNKEIETNSIENNVYEISRNLPNDEIKQKFIDETIHKGNMNPYYDKININIYSSQYRTLITKIQEFLKKNYSINKILQYNEEKLLVKYSKNYDEINYKKLLEKYNIVVLIKYNNVTIYIRNKNYKSVYEFLKIKENYWKQSNKCIHSNNKKTGLDFTNEKILLQILKLSQQGK